MEPKLVNYAGSVQCASTAPASEGSLTALMKRLYDQIGTLDSILTDMEIDVSQFVGASIHPCSREPVDTRSGYLGELWDRSDAIDAALDRLNHIRGSFSQALR